MSVTNHERPGVYSRYDASTVVKGRGGGGGCVGLAALCGTGTAGTLYTFNRYEEAVTAFGGEETLTELVRLLFLNGAAQVKAVPVAEEAGYKAAFSVLEAAEDIAVVVCDSGELTVQQALRDSVKAASEARRERIAVVGGKAGENATALVQRAEGLNSERVVLTAPVGEGGGAAVAAAVAGAIAGESDPAILKRYGTLSERFEAFGGYDTDVAVNKIANGLSIPDAQRQQLFDSLSGGEP